MSALNQLKTLIAALPATPLRPAGTPQLSNALESIVSRASKRAGGGDGPQERIWEGMSGSLERLKSGAAGRAYPLSSRTLRPAHDPMYYTRIKEGVHLSAQGKGRSWWKSFFQLKGDA